jgi:putative Ca2+/H+ antiporter (TMEM165/GDT1 family)
LTGEGKIARGKIMLFLVGGLIPTTLVTLLLATLFEKLWGDRVLGILLANMLSAVFCVLFATWGMDSFSKALNYLIPQTVVLVITVLRWRGRKTVSLTGAP